MAEHRLHIWQISHKVFPLICPFTQEVYTVGMPEVVDARAAAGMWDACIFQIPPEVPVNIYQGHRLAGTYHKEILILRRRRMNLLFQLYTSGREQRVERDNTVFVVFSPL